MVVADADADAAVVVVKDKTNEFDKQNISKNSRQTYDFEKKIFMNNLRGKQE